MDDRQTEIRAGAGLEDSRINKEFIDFLNKWSSPIIMVFAVAALVWAGLRWLEEKKIAKVDSAFGELHAATAGGNPSPATLNALAAEYEGVRAVPELAKLTTVDLYLNAFLRGVQPGAMIGFDGQPLEESDKLDEQQRENYLEQAGTLAREVVTLTEGDEGKVLLTIQALIRSGSVAECKRDFDGARNHYQRVKTLAENAKIPSLVEFGQMRIDALESFDSDMQLPFQDDLVSLPGEESMDLPDETEVSIDGTDEMDDAPAPEEEVDSEENAESEAESDPESETEQP
ncbi:MAG: hypothetical protein JJ974_12360 [Phycisphaerales bacterium]|nr:hypothetical protein [Phycisphaerales bacterium]